MGVKTWIGLSAWLSLLRSPLAVAVTVLGLAACGEPGGTATTTEPSAESTTTPTTAAPTTTTTTPPTTTSTPSITSTTVAQPGITLEWDGLGVVKVGSEPEATVEALESVLGPPDEDMDWGSDMQAPLGYCNEADWRLVRWGQLGVLFTEGLDPEDHADQGERHFHNYAYGSWLDVPADENLLRTSAGLTLGDSRETVTELYGDQATFNAGNEIFGPYITIDFGGVSPIIAWLDPEATTVGAIYGGATCGE